MDLLELKRPSGNVGCSDERVLKDKSTLCWQKGVSLAQVMSDTNFVDSSDEAIKNFRDCEPRRLEMMNALQYLLVWLKNPGREVTAEQWPFELEYMQKVEESFMRVIVRLSFTDEAKKRENESKVKVITFPKLEISQFDGNLDNWIQFKDQLEETIYTNADLQNVQKVQIFPEFFERWSKRISDGYNYKQRQM
jgi:hypothetical protein